MRPFVCLLLVAVVARADEATPVSPEVRAVVEQWLTAQNRGDFAGYEKLYADGFSGIRRSGARTAAFDRAGWLRDRKRMFAKPITVEIAELRLATVGAQSIARFQQSWASGGYQDVGQKQLTIAGGQITREEMFDSAKVGSAAKAPAIDELAFVVDGAVMIAADPDEAWGRGPARLVSHGNPAVARKSAVPPAAQRALAGKRVRLFSFAGPVCEATLADRFAIVAREADAWLQDRPPAKEERAQLAAELFEMGQTVLVAELKDVSGDCKGARFARAAALPVPAMVTAEPPPPVLREPVLAAYRALPAWKSLEKTWRADAASKEPGAPREWDGGKEVRELWMIKTPARTLVGVRSFTGFSCGEFGGGLWAIYELDGKGAPTLRFDGTQRESLELLRPHHAIDLDGDGEPELLFDGILAHGNYDLGVLKRAGARYDTAGGLSVSYQHCHC